MQDTLFFHDLAERLRSLGHEVEEKTEYHFRVNGRLDVYPVNRRYHDIELNVRGGYKDVIGFVEYYFRNLNEIALKPLDVGEDWGMGETKPGD